MAFVLGMRNRGVNDVSVLRALETVPRHLFVPHLYADLAWRDLALPIACGQTMPEPWLVARMMEALQLAPNHRVLEIGAGSGYATAIIAKLAGEVVSLERFATLATEAGLRLQQLGIENARVVHADGLMPDGSLGAFDRVLIHGLMPAMPDAISGLVAESGVLVFSRINDAGRNVIICRNDEPGGRWRDVEICACRATELIPGKSLII
jgi:protein-L-isoaspartate(D-aspartate) O-methyltransferase